VFHTAFYFPEPPIQWLPGAISQEVKRPGVKLTTHLHLVSRIRMVELRSGADKSLAFPISYFPICSTTKRIFLGWIKEVKTMKS
jgi:hypothetical protein